MAIKLDPYNREINELHCIIMCGKVLLIMVLGHKKVVGVMIWLLLGQGEPSKGLFVCVVGS